VAVNVLQWWLQKLQKGNAWMALRLVSKRKGAANRRSCIGSCRGGYSGSDMVAVVHSSVRGELVQAAAAASQQQNAEHHQQFGGHGAVQKGNAWPKSDCRQARSSN
jgi:hypothetical protein